MALTTFQKISGCLIITQTTGYGRYYSSTALANGKFVPSSDGTSVNITVGNDVYSLAYTDIRVTSTTATTLSDALTLLNSIFGT